MALAVIEAETGCCPSVLDLDQIQLDQFKHDEMYHREIARLSTQDRLKHMALHFAKYAGNLAEAGDDDAVMKKTVVDTFVIAVSTANILNLRLSEVVEPEASQEAGFDFARTLTARAGKMAAACEKLDHLEEFPFRSTIRESAVALLRAAVRESENQGWNLASLVRTRLAGVKKKMIFHGQL